MGVQVSVRYILGYISRETMNLFTDNYLMMGVTKKSKVYVKKVLYL